MSLLRKKPHELTPDDVIFIGNRISGPVEWVSEPGQYFDGDTRVKLKNLDFVVLIPDDTVLVVY